MADAHIIDYKLVPAARTASKIDAEGMLIVPIDEVADAELTALFDAEPEMRDLVGAPRYWSPAHGYWPKPANGWRVTS